MSLNLLVRLGVFGVLLVWLPLASAAPVKETKTTEESPAQKLKKDLDVAITVEIEMPLSQAINELREQTKLNIVLDKQTILLMGMDPDNSTTVTLKGKNLKLRSGLKTMLQQCNLTYAIVGDTLLVTTEEMAIYRQFKQRVSLELDKVELKAAVKKLANETGVNIIIDPKVAKEAAAAVSVELDDVPLEAAVRLLAEQASLKAVRVGNVIMVTSKEAAKGLKEDGDLAPKPNPYPGYEGVVPVAPGAGIGGGAVAPAAPPADK